MATEDTSVASNCFTGIENCILNCIFCGNVPEMPVPVNTFLDFDFSSTLYNTSTVKWFMLDVLFFCVINEVVKA